jgi:hypothetical protein
MGQPTICMAWAALCKNRTPHTEYFLGDALGSVRQMTDSIGAVTPAQNYDPYGVAIQRSGSAASRYGFDGEQVDQYGVSSLRYILKRCYWVPGLWANFGEMTFVT